MIMLCRFLFYLYQHKNINFKIFPSPFVSGVVCLSFLLSYLVRTILNVEGSWIKKMWGVNFLFKDMNDDLVVLSFV